MHPINGEIDYQSDKHLELLNHKLISVSYLQSLITDLTSKLQNFVSLWN